MEYLGLVGLIALMCMLFYVLKNHKSPYDEVGLKKYLTETKEEASEIIKRLKNKRQ